MLLFECRQWSGPYEARAFFTVYDYDERRILGRLIFSMKGRLMFMGFRSIELSPEQTREIALVCETANAPPGAFELAFE